MRILITNVQLNGRTGTEIVVRDLALGLRARGHMPMIYCPKPGIMSDELLAAGLCVVTDLADLPDQPDIIHGHHHIETVQACLHFPHVPAIFVVHDRRSPHDHPPLLDAIRRYIAVDENCLERLNGLPKRIRPERIAMIYNAVDLARFRPRPPLPQKPRKAVIFSNYAQPGNHYDFIRTACEHVGLPLDVIGSRMNNSAAHPEELLVEYDLVFAKARCAIEAMAVGCAVILCDARGMGEMVTGENAAAFQRWNYGARLLSHPLEVERLEAEIARYSAGEAEAASAFIRQHAALPAALDRYLALYQAVLDELPARPVQPFTIYDDMLDLLRTISAANEQIEQVRRGLSDDPLALLPGKLAIKIITAPRTAAAGAKFSIRVNIHNQHEFALRSDTKNPLYLSYHWLAQADGGAVIHEGQRTPLHAPVFPYDTVSTFMLVEAPPQAGSYRLRATFVQEEIAWLDNPPHACFDEALIEVNDV